MRSETLKDHTIELARRYVKFNKLELKFPHGKIYVIVANTRTFTVVE